MAAVTVGSLLGRLAANWPDKKIPEATFDLMRERLSGVPLPLLEQAVNEIIDGDRWFPNVARIREVAAERLLELPTEAVALALVEAAFRRPSGDTEGAPAVPPLVGEALAALGGLSALRRSEEPRRDLDRFGRIYRELRASAVRAACLEPTLEPGTKHQELPA